MEENAASLWPRRKLTSSALLSFTRNIKERLAVDPITGNVKSQACNLEGESWPFLEEGPNSVELQITPAVLITSLGC